MSIASELGLSHAESEWVVAAAARHHEAGATYREAIEMALRDLLALWTEMAHGKTDRSKRARKTIVKTLHQEIRRDNGQEVA